MKTYKYFNIVFENTKGPGRAGFVLTTEEGQLQDAARWQSFRGEYDNAFFKSKEEFVKAVVRYLNNPKAKISKAKCQQVVYEKNKHTDGQWRDIDLSTFLPIGSARISDVLSIL